jgi:hypothetical protein
MAAARRFWIANLITAHVAEFFLNALSDVAG